MKEDIETAATQIESWLRTVHSSNRQAPQGMTLLPAAGTDQPLMRSFSKKGPGSSAALLEVGDTLAEGGMGVIKVAKQKALGRTVVIKTMRGDYEMSAAENVLREAWATGALEHPNIVPVHDVRVGPDGTPVIVLKRIEGDSWTTLMHNEELLRERFGVRDALNWNLNVLTQVCQAVRFAHSRNILHRDLKPDNVMIGSFGEVYLVDWGIAVSLSDDIPDCPLPSASEEGSMAGTPCYMAPEMLGQAALDARTDVYLLGGLLFEVLANRPPHRTGSLAEILEDIKKSEPDVPQNAPLLLASLVRRAMAANPDDRFETAEALADELRHFQQTRGSQVLETEARERLDELKKLVANPDAPSQEVHPLFGAIRFGFETAIEAWPENLQAARSLDEARLCMAEYELSNGHAAIANGHYQEVGDAPADLGQRIAKALSQREQEQAELERFRGDADWEEGMRTRIVLTLGLGSIWTLLPLLTHLFHEDLPSMTYPMMIVLTLGLAMLSLGAWFWAWESMRKTDLNRRISRLLFTLFPMQILLFSGLYILEVPAVQGELLMLFVWTALLGAATATIDGRFMLLTVFNAIAFLYAARFPEHRYFAMSAANGAFVITGLYIFSRERQPRSWPCPSTDEQERN